MHRQRGLLTARTPDMVDVNDKASDVTGNKPSSKAVMLYTTWPSSETAEAAARQLLVTQVAACVNIMPGTISLYRWQGQIEQASEVVMLIKTTARLADDCVRQVQMLHPYANPAALVLPVAGGASAFLDWIVAETRQPTCPPTF
jgi:periplasmic divalent cation tolerance protein